MSDTNRMRLSYIAETSFGVPPSGNLIDVRYTGESLKQVSQTQRSNEIRSDRQISDIVRTMIGAEGDINTEMSYGAHDDFIAASLLASSLTWSTAVTVTASTISASSVDNSLNDSANGLSAFVVGQWVKVSGFTGAGITANAGFFKIVSVTAAKIVVSGGTLVTDAAGESVTIKMGEQVVNGTTLNSFAFEKKYQDLTNIFAKYLGMCPQTWKQSVKADQLITGSFGWLGKSETSTTATIGSGYTSAPTNEVMAGVDDIFGIIENGATLSDINSLDFGVNNNLRNRLRVGTLGAFSIGTGTFEVEGSAEMYFSTHALMDKYLNFTSTSLAIVISDGAGKSYVVEWPTIKFTDGTRVAGGINQDIMANMKFMAKVSPTEGITMRVTRWS
jgi:hypothetical protein